MKAAAGRVIFFDAIATGILRLHPGALPQMLALKFTHDEAIGPEDKLDIAKAVCRMIGVSDAHVDVRKLGEAIPAPIGLLVIDAVGTTITTVLKPLMASLEETSRVVFIGYIDNDSAEVSEVIFEGAAERRIIEEATKNLFEATKTDYEPLAPHRFRKSGFSVFAEAFDLFDDPVPVNWGDRNTIEEFCYNICEIWQYDGAAVEGDDIFQWVMQFKEAGLVNEACELLSYLKREGYVTKKAIVGQLTALYEDLCGRSVNTPTVVSIQPPGKSEQLLAYGLRPLTGYITLEKALSLLERKVIPPNIVCFDDAIVSGKTTLDCLFDSRRNPAASVICKLLQEDRVKITVITSHADERGVKAIVDDPRCCGRVQVLHAVVIDDRRRVFSPESRVLPISAKKDEFRSFCEGVGNKIYPDNPLGWFSACWCVVFDYSVPNGTLPVIFGRSDSVPWKPLFERKRSAMKKVKS